MKQIKIDYKDYELSNESIKQLRKADMCNEEIRFFGTNMGTKTCTREKT